MAGQGGVGVRLTGRGWVGAGGAGQEVGEGGAGPEGGGAKLSGSEVGEGDGDLSGLAAEAGWRSYSVVSTEIATLESKV